MDISRTYWEMVNFFIFFLPDPGPPAGAAGFFGGGVTDVRMKYSSFMTVHDQMC